MADDSAGETFGKVVLGGAVGFALYFFVTGLGFGGRGEGSGEGSGEGRRGELPPSPLPRPKDAKPLSFVMQEPEVVGHPMAFRLRDDDPSTKTYSLEETIARIKAGGRADMNLRIRGGVIHGPADEAPKLFKRAGIQVWKEESSPTPSPPHVSGNARGYYGNRRWMP